MAFSSNNSVTYFTRYKITDLTVMLKAQLNVSMVIVSLACIWELCRHLLNNFEINFHATTMKPHSHTMWQRTWKQKFCAQNGFYQRTQYFISSSLAKSTLHETFVFKSFARWCMRRLHHIAIIFCNFFPWRFRLTRRQRSPEIQHGRLHTTWHTNTN